MQLKRMRWPDPSGNFRSLSPGAAHHARKPGRLRWIAAGCGFDPALSGRQLRPAWSWETLRSADLQFPLG
jgi:hypothetical protein